MHARRVGFLFCFSLLIGSNIGWPVTTPFAVIIAYSGGFHEPSAFA